MGKFRFTDLIKSDNVSTSLSGMYNNIVGFRGVVDGVGTSTIVRNTAEFLANHGYDICIVDTHICKHTLASLCGSVSTDKKSMLHYKDGNDIRDFIQPTVISKKVFFVDAIHSTEDDIISTWDNADVFLSLLSRLRSCFSFILINLSNELSQINDAAVGKCNLLYPVLTPSLTCTSNLQNFMVSNYKLCVLSSNTQWVIVNQLEATQEETINLLFSDKSNASTNLKIAAKLPFSPDIYKANCLGKSLVKSELTTPKSILDFSQGIHDLCVNILDRNSKSLSENNF